MDIAAPANRRSVTEVLRHLLDNSQDGFFSLRLGVEKLELPQFFCPRPQHAGLAASSNQSSCSPWRTRCSRSERASYPSAARWQLGLVRALARDASDLLQLELEASVTRG